MMKTNSDESAAVLLRRLIDEIVEDLSRAQRCRSSQFKNRASPQAYGHPAILPRSLTKSVSLLLNTVLQALSVIFSEPTV